MKKLILALLFAALATAAKAEEKFTPIVETVIGSVVKVNARYMEISTDSKHEVSFYSAFGAGVVVSSQGHILTCEHVVSKGPFLISVQLYGSTNSFITATVLRRSFSKDIALLKLVNYSTPTVPVPLGPAPRVGDEVIAIGHPLGIDWTVTTGIISGQNREGLAVNLLQTDAAINPGNSGGPLFNLHGQVVGLNESKVIGASNLGFAVSVDEIRKFLDVYRGLEVVYEH